MIIKTRIGLSLLSIVVALSLMAGATFAFFEDTATSTGNTFGAGTLDVQIVDQNGTDGFTGETIVTGWVPGETALVEFDVRNIGDTPVHLSGFATGTWNVDQLDSQNAVKVIKVERWNGSAWEELRSANAGITGRFYYTDNGQSNGTPIVVEPDARAQLRLTVKFDESAGNDFQGKTFTSGVTVYASQTNAPLPTP